ncbi:MAG: hypothetical protein KAS72_07535 [Phycisphaerales bacterium]|nr:hypothetical protein [Phycisphaerales bacterium]
MPTDRVLDPKPVSQCHSGSYLLKYGLTDARCGMAVTTCSPVSRRLATYRLCGTIARVVIGRKPITCTQADTTPAHVP